MGEDMTTLQQTKSGGHHNDRPVSIGRHLRMARTCVERLQRAILNVLSICSSVEKKLLSEEWIGSSRHFSAQRPAARMHQPHVE
jgi:hypothetical protein